MTLADASSDYATTFLNGAAGATHSSPSEPSPEEELRQIVQGRAKRVQVDGATFILDGPTEVQAVWGEGDQVAWAAGEPLLINGSTGVGKTTIAQQVALARLGLRSEVLGMAVKPDLGNETWWASTWAAAVCGRWPPGWPGRTHGGSDDPASAPQLHGRAVTDDEIERAR